MDHAEQEALRKALEMFYDKSIVDSWKMNDMVLRVFSELVEKESSCTDLISLLPPPTPLRPDYRYFKSYIRQFVRNLIDKPSAKGKIMQICRSAAMYGYKTKFDMASQGINLYTLDFFE
jgi:hypothetical protein